MDDEGLRLAVHFALVSGAVGVSWFVAFRRTLALRGIRDEWFYRCVVWGFWFEAIVFWLRWCGWVLPAAQW